MTRRRVLGIIGVIVIAILLAFSLREFVNQLILWPVAYVLWLLGLLYRSIDQQIWWIILGVILFFMLGFSLLPEIKQKQKIIKLHRRERGNVETLAGVFQKSGSGIYFKWLVANRLGKLAHQMLVQREHGKARSVFAPLTAEGWDVDPGVQNYLEKGLLGSFADYPNTNLNYFSAPEKSPLDHDVKEVIEFLESQQQGNSHL